MNHRRGQEEQVNDELDHSLAELGQALGAVDVEESHQVADEESGAEGECDERGARNPEVARMRDIDDETGQVGDGKEIG